MTNAFSRAEIQLHVAAQILALTGINFVEKEDDDSHTTSFFDAQRARISGRSFTLGTASFRVFINVREFALGLQMDDSDHRLLPLDRLSYEEAIDTWKQWLAEVGNDGELIRELHYDLPDSDAYRFKYFEKPTEDALNEWIALRTMANDVLAMLTVDIGIDSEINIWPHHFDTGTYYGLHKTDGVIDRSIGAGLGVADSIVPEPYLYIYGWNKDASINYANAPDLGPGRWISGAWEGAILPSSSSENADDFFRVATGFLKDVLS